MDANKAFSVSTRKRETRPWDSRGLSDSLCKSKWKDDPSMGPQCFDCLETGLEDQTRDDNHPSTMETNRKSYSCPSIQVDGKRYYADRFYLLTPHGDNKSEASTKSMSNQCTCGAQQPPPTLDRSRLVQSLDLQAAIVGTYTVSPSHVMDLFQNVPTLVLHGHKGLDARMSPVDANDEMDSIDSQESCRHEDDQCSDGMTRSNAGQKCLPDQVDSSSSTVKKDEDPPEEAFSIMKSYCHDPIQINGIFPKSLHFTRILTKWLPPRSYASKTTYDNASNRPSRNEDDNLIIVIDDSDDDNESIGQGVPNFPFQGVDQTIVKKRLSKRGVHHPKFMLLFEKCGSLVVVVSTSNLTRQESLDGVWVQRFDRSETNSKPDLSNNCRSSPKHLKDRRYDGSDFGYVLTDFLQKQSDAAEAGAMLPVEFLRRYLNIDSLDDFCNAYSFEDSQIHLIATVPGDYEGKQGATHLGRKDGTQTYLYGAQRVEDIMDRLKAGKDQNMRPWFSSTSSSLMSNDDRLLLQPTSLGGHWTTSNFTHLVRTYLGVEANDSRALERADIIWPTSDFIHSVSQRDKSVLPCGCESQDVNGAGGLIFLASDAFNSIDLNVISRMTQYAQSNPPQVCAFRTPHFKSYARVFEGNEYALRQAYGVGKAAEMFSWFLMTSACLSRGAQGTPTESRSEDSDQVSYSNFELGVLFCSRLQGDAASDRVYCWKPNQCFCGSNETRTKLIHLPIPYSVRTQPYQSDPDEAHMCKTPYFHEISPESACVGLMALTPYGRIRAAKESVP